MYFLKKKKKENSVNITGCKKCNDHFGKLMWRVGKKVIQDRRSNCGAASSKESYE